MPCGAKQAEEMRRRIELGDVMDPCVWTDRMQATLVRGVEGGKWYSLMDKVGALPTLQRAWELVKSNDGAGGVDGVSIEWFGRDVQTRLSKLAKDLRKGVYKPKSVLRKWIDKPGSTEPRPLGIPTVRDRIVQTALRLVIEPIFEIEFAPSSHGFRRGHSCHDALLEVEQLLEAGYTWVLDADVKSYFDTISHQKLMELVSERIADGRVLDLISAFLEAEILDGLTMWKPEEGTPQGAVISPLLANIYLNVLDQRMASLGYRMIRYADDFVLLCESEAQAQLALAEVLRYMSAWDLELHPTKTRIVDARLKGEGFDFLGYHFERGGKMWPSKQSMKTLRSRLKPLTKRTAGVSMGALAHRINLILRGWYAYFKLGNSFDRVALDSWLRGRLRSILRKRCKRRGRARGIDHQRWPNAHFHALGFFSLGDASELDRLSLFEAKY